MVLFPNEETDTVRVRGARRFQFGTFYRRWTRWLGVRDSSAGEQT